MKKYVLFEQSRYDRLMQGSDVDSEKKGEEVDGGVETNSAENTDMLKSDKVETDENQVADVRTDGDDIKEDKSATVTSDNTSTSKGVDEDQRGSLADRWIVT